MGICRNVDVLYLLLRYVQDFQNAKLGFRRIELGIVWWMKNIILKYIEIEHAVTTN